MNEENLKDYFKTNGGIFITVNETGARGLIVERRLHEVLIKLSHLEQCLWMGPLLFFYYIHYQKGIDNVFRNYDNEPFQVLGPLAQAAINGAMSMVTNPWGSITIIGDLGSAVKVRIKDGLSSAAESAASYVANEEVVKKVGKFVGERVDDLMTPAKLVGGFVSGKIKQTLAPIAFGAMKQVAYIAYTGGSTTTLAITNGVSTAAAGISFTYAIIPATILVSGVSYYTYVIRGTANCFEPLPMECIVDDFNAPVSYPMECFNALDGMCRMSAVNEPDSERRDEINTLCNEMLKFVKAHIDDETTTKNEFFHRYFKDISNDESVVSAAISSLEQSHMDQNTIRFLNQAFEYIQKNRLKYCQAFAELDGISQKMVEWHHTISSGTKAVIQAPGAFINYVKDGFEFVMNTTSQIKDYAIFLLGIYVALMFAEKIIRVGGTISSAMIASRSSSGGGGVRTTTPPPPQMGRRRPQKESLPVIISQIKQTTNNNILVIKNKTTIISTPPPPPTITTTRVHATERLIKNFKETGITSLNENDINKACVELLKMNEDDAWTQTELEFLTGVFKYKSNAQYKTSQLFTVEDYMSVVLYFKKKLRLAGVNNDNLVERVLKTPEHITTTLGYT